MITQNAKQKDFTHPPSSQSRASMDELWVSIKHLMSLAYYVQNNCKFTNWHPKKCYSIVHTVGLLLIITRPIACLCVQALHWEKNSVICLLAAGLVHRVQGQYRVWIIHVVKCSGTVQSFMFWDIPVKSVRSDQDSEFWESLQTYCIPNYILSCQKNNEHFTIICTLHL